MGKVAVFKERSVMPIIVLLAVSVVLPLIFRNEYVNSVLISCLLWAAIGGAFDLTAGYIRVTNFGFAGFFAAGAYTSALLSYYLKISPFITTLPAMVVAAGFGAFVGYLTLRLHGIFAACFSWFMAEMLKYIIAAAPEITRGYHGLMPPVYFAGITRLPYYYLIIIMYIVQLIVLLKIVRGKIGFAFKIIGEDETAAKTIGVNVTYYRVLCWTVSCLFAGLLGAFYAHYIGVLTPDVSSLSITVPALAICYVGGRGTLWGSIPSAFIIILIFEAFRPLAAYRFIIYGILLIIVMIWAQGGLASILSKFSKYIKWKPS
jgi:branched-chain amino acid transport system permease protein